jgi:hypothetical protein
MVDTFAGENALAEDGVMVGVAGFFFGQDRRSGDAPGLQDASGEHGLSCIGGSRLS